VAKRVVALHYPLSIIHSPLQMNRLVSYFNLTKKTVQEYVAEISRHCRYKSMVTQMPEGGVLDDRSRLIDLYDACLMQDAHLAACMQTLYSYLTGDTYMLASKQTGEWVADEELSEKVQGMLFEKIIHAILDARFYGYTLLHIVCDTDGDNLLKSVEEVERRNVLPSQHRAVKRQGQWAPGWNLHSAPLSRNYVLIDTGGLGIFATTTPLVLAKKYTAANWVNLCHTYSEPVIHGKCASEDKASHERLAMAIANAAQKKVLVTGTDDSIDIKTFGTNTSDRLFLSLIDSYANSEMSNLILGSKSMAGEQQAYVGSAKVHEGIFMERIKTYRAYVENVINSQVMPLLRYWKGVAPSLTFRYKLRIEN